MVRLRSLVVPGLVHHVTQRGNRRAQTFFEDADFELYRDMITRTVAEIIEIPPSGG